LGHVLGDWAAHKEPGKGVCAWTITHRPTGIAVNVYPAPENKEQAIAQFRHFHEKGPEWYQADALARSPRIA
jgi:hypothetical protein